MIRIIQTLFFCLYSITLLGQNTTPSNTTTSWESATWSLGLPEDPIVESRNIQIGGYVTKSGNLNLGISKNGSTLYDLIIADTLVITGSVNTDNNAHSIVVPVGGVLIVFGNFTMNNKVDIANGGIVVVMGDLTINGGSGTDYSGTGDIYVEGTVSGTNGTQVTNVNNVDQPITNLQSGGSGEPDLYDFLINGGSSPLPITLKEFKAEPNYSSIGLNWTTLTEENFEYFEIQRAAADGIYSVIATVEGNGFSKEEINYSWSDENPRIGLNYYRLESVDYDGFRETFPSVALIYEPQNRQVSITPNPVALNSQIKLNNTFGESFTMKVLSLDGSTVLDFEGEANIISLPASLKSGIYLAVFEVNGLKKTQKLIIR